jgi:hypothetical protein
MTKPGTFASAAELAYMYPLLMHKHRQLRLQLRFSCNWVRVPSFATQNGGLTLHKDTFRIPVMNNTYKEKLYTWQPRQNDVQCWLVVQQTLLCSPLGQEDMQLIQPA